MVIGRVRLKISAAPDRPTDWRWVCPSRSCASGYTPNSAGSQRGRYRGRWRHRPRVRYDLIMGERASARKGRTEEQVVVCAPTRRRRGRLSSSRRRSRSSSSSPSRGTVARPSCGNLEPALVSRIDGRKPLLAFCASSPPSSSSCLRQASEPTHSAAATVDRVSISGDKVKWAPLSRSVGVT